MRSAAQQYALHRLRRLGNHQEPRPAIDTSGLGIEAAAQQVLFKRSTKAVCAERKRQV